VKLSPSYYIMYVFAAVDPFSSMMANPAPSAASHQPHSLHNVLSTSEQEPQLLVPSSNPTESLEQTPIYPTFNTPTQLSNPSMLQPPGNTPPSVYSTPSSNPYSRSALSGHQQRAMFPSNTQFFDSATTTSKPFPPNPAPPLQTNQATPPSFENLASLSSPPLGNTSTFFQPVVPHWFFRKKLSDNHLVWCPFSYLDSSNLESAYSSGIQQDFDFDISVLKYFCCYSCGKALICIIPLHLPFINRNCEVYCLLHLTITLLRLQP